MKIVILHGDIAKDAGPDEQDTLVQAAFVAEGLEKLGHEPLRVPVSLNLEKLRDDLSRLRPAVVFNLVESLAGRGSLVHVVPALLDALGIPCTGAGTEALFVTSNKLLTKERLIGAGLPTAPWLAGTDGSDDAFTKGRWIVKSVWEHASLGLDEDSVLFAASRQEIADEMALRKQNLGGACFAEKYIDGREFNVSLLAGDALPPAEILFDAYPAGKIRVVGYRAKWEEGSFEYAATRRSFSFSGDDEPLLERLVQISLQCWRVFSLRGYARVDFRVDEAGNPWILEVNANPCLSPDAGFLAAAARAGLSLPDVLRRILDEALR